MEASILNDYFEKCMTTSTQGPLTVSKNTDETDDFHLKTVSTFQVLKMLRALKEDTATGPDELPAKLIKRLAPAIAINITKIINRSIASSCFPKSWKKANVTAVWKGKGSKSDPANYRPISVLPVLARMFEKESARQLTSYCESKQIIPREQFGFRAKSSCELALLHALDGWMEDIDSGRSVGALLIDLSKAFDSVSHQKLLDDLAEVGCSVSTTSWFSSYLTDRKQKVIDPSGNTDWKEVKKGVPQGSCLSPLLFNIFVRKLPEACKVRSMQFADDVTEYHSDVDARSITMRLEDSFKRTKDYCDSRDLIINATKTQWIIFKSPNRKLPDDLAIIVDGCSITRSESVKLLGVTLDSHLTFNEHIQRTSKKCHGMIGVLARASPSLPREILRLAYIALVRSHLEYSSAIFSSASATQLKKLDTIQKISSRVVCSAPRDAHAAPLIRSLQLDSLESRRTLHIIALVQSVLSGNCHPALRHMFVASPDGTVTNSELPRIKIGQRRFSVFARELYNLHIRSRQD